MEFGVRGENGSNVGVQMGDTAALVRVPFTFHGAFDSCWSKEFVEGGGEEVCFRSGQGFQVIQAEVLSQVIP